MNSFLYKILTSSYFPYILIGIFALTLAVYHIPLIPAVISGGVFGACIAVEEIAAEHRALMKFKELSENTSCCHLSRLLSQLPYRE